jgi:hypothetical protein
MAAPRPEVPPLTRIFRPSNVPLPTSGIVVHQTTVCQV